MIVYGASGHGKVIIEILELNGYQSITLWDDGDKTSLGSYMVGKPNLEKPKGDKVVISIGDNATRKKIAKKLLPLQQLEFITAQHPMAIVSQKTEIGVGTVIMAGATVNPDTNIGMHCILNTNSSIDHDCVIEDYVHLSPNSTLCGNVTVKEGTHIGTGAILIPGVTVGKWCTIGAGAVIISDIPDYATVVGNPGKIIKTVKPQDEI